MIIEDLVRMLLDAVGAAGVPVALVVGLVSAAYYGRHVLAAGAVIGTWFRFALAGSVLLAVLLASGVVSLDLGRLVDGAGLVADLIRMLLEVV